MKKKVRRAAKVSVKISQSNVLSSSGDIITRALVKVPSCVFLLVFLNFDVFFFFFLASKRNI